MHFMLPIIFLHFLLILLAWKSRPNEGVVLWNSLLSYLIFLFPLILSGDLISYQASYRYLDL
jgi:hypothetical protein